jgi:transcriptional regulator with XRE-family HTH domain
MNRDTELVFDAEAFTRARKIKGWSVADVARETGLSASALHKLSQGQRHMPRGRTYRRLLAAFRLEPGDLLMEAPREHAEPAAQTEGAH